MFVIVTGKVAKVPCNYGRSRQTIYSFSLPLFPNKINLITEMPCNQVSSADFPLSCHRSNQSEWMAKKNGKHMLQKKILYVYGILGCQLT